MILLGSPKNTTQKIIKVIFVSCLAVVLVVGYLLSNAKPAQSTAAVEASMSEVVVKNPVANEPQPRKAMAEIIDIKAPAAISVKIGTGENAILLGKNETQPLPIASLTKLMTALVVLENYDLDKKIVVTDAAMAEAGQQGSLKAGELLSVKDLLYITLIESSNRAAYALTEAMGPEKFVETMNAAATRLGLVDTRFADSTGLSSDSYSSAQDIATLSSHLLNRQSLFLEIIGLKEYDLYDSDGQLHHRLINTNELLGQVDGVIGGKTGWTPEAKGCFMVIEKSPDGTGYIISVVLGSDDRFTEIQKLINSR
ncbi:MAG TPA: serine hydrolase [Negativicutes bacterium]|uniref:Peptidase S11 D-alanyl-D-alanine carboxypeptidase A N-terminal domain-containing protein n=1 Tax=Candidatus Staskawiczbacteria bacterium RIFCSPHIGHO2_01_FULL_41_41 TaxID=1802203 RepID=A0A1G2HV20_9BACT|nr:MAG: hypothetical protein A2822_04865 [Candidatus Staskawiczbacteria bacterium RIFCSPHIGHO2_01_FULL_41_41]OGZ74403.1 MAG: hypothetical protein A3A12_01370 [Candidatus Staskawiczbacteria bacterium RIFCSPLOWO2_01_FULL_43_17b]HLD70280.1 serine hydrolase [Negativicutes bacterium]